MRALCIICELADACELPLPRIAPSQPPLTSSSSSFSCLKWDYCVTTTIGWMGKTLCAHARMACVGTQSEQAPPPHHLSSTDYRGSSTSSIAVVWCECVYCVALARTTHGTQTTLPTLHASTSARMSAAHCALRAEGDFRRTRHPKRCHQQPPSPPGAANDRSRNIPNKRVWCMCERAHNYTPHV